MRMFKVMNATFNVARDTAHENGFAIDRSKFVFAVERNISGASAYGDRSAHTIKINGDWYRGYDTRYDGITTDKEEWIKFWKEDLEKEFKLELNLVEYSEKEVELEEK